ncbi:MAG: PLP-dependent aminotransferase family protein [Pseudoruegeria sp.]
MNTIWFPDLTDIDGPKYQVLTESIRQAVLESHLKPTEKLPPVRELAWALKITPGTVARAYKILVDEGVLKAEVGRGTFVAEQNLLEDLLLQFNPKTLPWVEHVDLRSPGLPELGQGILLKDALVDMASGPLDSMYHNYPNDHSDRPAREAVYNWLDTQDLGPFEPDDIVLTHGGQNAITLIFQTVLRGSDPVVFTEELSYTGFRHAARLSRAKIVSIPSDDEGLRPDLLHEAIHTYGGQILCTSPENHNPTVEQTTMRRRQELAEVISRHKLHVIEDDCYRMGRDRLPGYRALIPESAWYISSLSKELTPSLRVGYAVAPKGLANDLRRTRQHSSFGLAVPVAQMAERVLNDPRSVGVAKAVQERVDDYVRIAVNVLGGFDLSWRNGVPLLWLRLPRGWRASAFCRAAEREGVYVRSADDFVLIDGKAPHAIRIAINGRISPEQFEKGLQVLVRLLSNPADAIEV